MDKSDYFNSLLSSVAKCNICQRMCNRKKVLSFLNGNISSKVVFIAEAPGRLGAECTGIPLYGDVTGNNFETLLANIGWSRDDIFITNAILCNPQDDNGNNATPTHEEISNCSYYLEMIIELIKPEVIVTLGGRALEALNNIETHNYELKNDVATLVPWHGIKLFPMYHMSPRAAIHRSLTQQRADFITLSHEVSPKTGIKKQEENKYKPLKDVSRLQSRIASMVDYIVFKVRRISFFKLTKLLYLIDYNYLNFYNHTMSNCIYLRMQEGPWIPYLKNIVYENENIYTTMTNRQPILRYSSFDEPLNLSENEKDFIDKYVELYKDVTESAIKTAVYMTAPMKYILRQENAGRNMLKTPVIYKNLTIVELDN